MEAKTFFKDFELLAQAPNGIKKLRLLILKFAVEGKLVPQDSNDPPAHELLKSIETEKRHLAEAGKLKGSKMLQEIQPKNSLHELPNGWAWVQFGAISEIERGGSPRPIKSFLTDDPDGLNWIKIGDTEKGGKYITHTSQKILKRGLSKTRMVYPGDFLLTNSMSFGRPYITKIEGCIHDGWLRISPPTSLDKNYLYHLLSSPYVYENFKVAAAGAVVLNLNADKVRELPIPIPPLAEQKRIVAKVDELMGLCDEMEGQQEKRRTVHASLVRSAHDQLLTAPKPQAFKINWNRIANNFDHLYTTPDSIKQLRQTILQLAVQGKLVQPEQDDIEIEHLISKIAESRRSSNQKQVKSDSAHPESPPPYDMPTGYRLIQLNDLGYFLGGGTPTKSNPEYWEGEIPWVSPKDMKVPRISDSIDHISESAIQHSAAKLIPSPALLMVVRGMILLHSFPVGITGRPLAINQDMKALVPYLPETLDYLLLVCQAERNRMLENVLRSSHGTCRIGTETIKGFQIPLPSINIQAKTLQRTAHLMSLCDDLESKLTRSEADADKLMEAMVHHLTVA